jgi:hypothetical protein
LSGAKVLWGAATLALAALSACVLALPFDSLTGGPSSQYSFEEQTGTVANDTYNRRPATLQSEAATGLPRWTRTGKRGGALEFIGTDGWIDILDLSGQKVPGRATIVMWLFMHQLPVAGTDDDAELMSIENDSPTGTGIQAMAGFVDGKGDVLFDRSSATEKRISRTGPISANAWFLIALGWDLAQNRTVLFVRQEGHQPYPLVVSDLPPGFGFVSPSFSVSTRNGIIDEVRYFDRMLPPSELEGLE